MHDVAIAFPPLIVMRAAVAAVWLYEGLWCKVLGRAQLEAQVVAKVPRFGPRFGQSFLKALGVIEVVLAAWVISAVYPGACATAEVALLVVLNVNGLLWSRDIIPDPAGMIVKNIAFLVLAWACGAIPGR
ncbi:MAG: DoxX-like family protein [Candidatus Binatus sp.]|uniref:DoxX-like family protein n=1 Tax=Candidatus Binatus sp. TaxID=2811406 RepID=UPI003C75C5EF